MLFGVNNNVSAGLTKWNQIQEGNKNKAKGVVAGVFDFGYMLPGKFVWMDGKIGNDILSKEQRDFKKKAEARGHDCIVFNSLEVFQEIIHTLQEAYYV